MAIQRLEMAEKGNSRGAWREGEGRRGGSNSKGDKHWNIEGHACGRRVCDEETRCGEPRMSELGQMNGKGQPEDRMARMPHFKKEWIAETAEQEGGRSTNKWMEAMTAAGSWKKYSEKVGSLW